MVNTGFTQMSRGIFLMIGYANQIDNFQTSGESGTREALNFTEENMEDVYKRQIGTKGHRRTFPCGNTKT